jgi:hypothetical protein
MAIDTKKTYTQTVSKLRVMWDTAMKLIGEYEDFNRRLSDLEKKASDISTKSVSITDRIKNV